MKNKRIISLFLASLFTILMITQNKNFSVSASDSEVLIVNDSKIGGETNKFTYFGEGWSNGATSDSYNGSGDEHYNAITTNTPNPNEKYYTIEFIGNKIEVYGHKSWNHGIVSYSIDEGTPVEVSSYNSSRIGNQLLFKAENLTEGKHTLTAVATGKATTGNNAVIQVDYAKVYHQKYIVEDIEIANENILMLEGAREQIIYSIAPDYGQTVELTYSSDNTKVATVSETGEVTAVGVGNATITVALEEFGISKEINVAVNQANPDIHGTIVDTNTHYGQDKYNDVLAKGIVSKELFAWKGDKAISEIALASKNSTIKNVTVTASDFISGENTLQSDFIKTTFLKETEAYIGDAGYHNQNDISMPTGPKQSVPDILYTEEVIDIGFNKVQAVWVEFSIPKDTVPGVYTGSLTVAADGISTPLVFNYSIEVLDATMPDVSEYLFDFEAWQYPYSSAEYYGVTPFSPEHFEILKPHMLKYKEMGGHAITTSIVEEAWGGQTYSKNEIRYPSMIKWTKKADGTFKFDFSDFDKWVKFNKDLGIGDKIICYSMIPWGNTIIYFDEAKNTTERVILNPGTAEYEMIWTQFLNALVPHLDEKGWFEDTYIGIDERANMSQAFDVVDKVKNKEGLTLKKAAAMDHFSTGYIPVTSRVDDISVGSTAAKKELDNYKAFVEDRKNSEKDYKTTIYTCTEHFPNSLALSMPGESYWTMMFSAAQGATGYMRWAFDAWVEDPLRDVTHWAFEAGDTALIYPDETDVTNPVSKSSVRLEKMAEGIRDVNKLYLMAAEVSSLEDDIVNLLNTVNVNYEGVKNGIGEHDGAKFATEVTREQLPSDMENIRQEIRDLTKKYIELKAKGTSEVTAVDTNKDNVSLKVGATETISATIAPENLLNKRVNWTSSNKEVATVNAQGVITAVAEGTAIITVTSEANNTIKKDISVTVTANDNSDNQIAFYDFEDIEDNNVVDKWNNYDGILEGAEVIDGVVGKALQFNKNSDNVTITSPATLSQSWTLAMWVKKGDIKDLPASIMWDGKPFQNTDKQTESIDIARDSAGNMGVHVKPGYLTVKKVLPKDEWVHLAWVNDKKTGLNVYVNGVSTGTNEWTKNNEFNAPLKVIGGRNYIGAIDEVKVYDKALTKSEVDEIRKVSGLNIGTTYVELMEGSTHQIVAELVTDNPDKELTYTSNDTKVATVDDKGLVTAKGYGDTVITVYSASTGYSKKVDVRVNKEMEIGYTIPQYEYPKEKQIVIDREQGQYLGQPDMILLDDNKTLFTVYPKGHGIGEVILKKSEDGGKNWSDRLSTNETWKNSMETPTIYKLNMTDGTTKLIQISGGPGWGDGFRGWKTSISEDSGETWSDYKEWYNGTTTIVAMASLIQLKDEYGNFIDKWMGVYHDYGYVNYKTYLTFDENGNEQWSTPEPYLSKWRDVESSRQICEVGMFRSPDGKRIVALARSQSHMHKSTMFYSDDEGKTWSKPREVQGALNGERHKIVYDPISERLIVTFREIILDYNKNGVIEDNDWMAGEWIAWVGTYEDLINGNEGQYRIKLADDYTPSPKSGDTGYAGLIALPDGTIVTNSYGCFDEDDPTNNNGGAYKTYIMGVRFKLGEIDNALGLVDKSQLNSLIKSVDNLNESDYTAESWISFKEALDNAKSGSERDDIQQKEVDELKSELEKAFKALEDAQITNGDVNGDGIVDIRDLAIVSKHYGKNGEDNEDEWDTIKILDINKDNKIDSKDIEYIFNLLL